MAVGVEWHRDLNSTASVTEFLRCICTNPTIVSVEVSSPVRMPWLMAVASFKPPTIKMVAAIWSIVSTTKMVHFPVRTLKINLGRKIMWACLIVSTKWGTTVWPIQLITLDSVKIMKEWTSGARTGRVIVNIGIVTTWMYLWRTHPILTVSSDRITKYKWMPCKALLAILRLKPLEVPLQCALSSLDARLATKIALEKPTSYRQADKPHL